MLNYKMLKLIKPTGAKDDYSAGTDNNECNRMSGIEKGRIYREQIYNLVLNKANITALGISEALGIGVKVVAGILQKMVSTKILKVNGKVSNPSGRSAQAYVVI